MVLKSILLLLQKRSADIGQKFAASYEILENSHG